MNVRAFSLLWLVASTGCKSNASTNSERTASSEVTAQPIKVPVPSGPKAEATHCDRSQGPCDGEATLASGGHDRTFRFHFPAPKTKDAKPGLVIALHGRGETGHTFEIATHLDKIANEHDLVVVYPDGIDKSWDSYGAKNGSASDGVDDVAFVSALIDYGVTTLGSDGARVAVVGFSNGAMMAQRIGCELADKVNAIGAVWGTMAEAEAPHCKPARPLSVIMFHGDADKRVPYTGRSDDAKTSELLSAPATIAKWAALEHCSASAITTDEPDIDPDDGTKTKRMTYSGCNKGVKVILFTIEGGEHRWPQGANGPFRGKSDGVSRDVDAGEMIWALGMK